MTLADELAKLGASCEIAIVPGRETKAYFAFCDLWEASRGSS